MIARAMLCIMLCLGATSAEAWQRRPCRRRRELWHRTLAVGAEALSRRAIQLGTAPSNPNELRITGLGGGQRSGPLSS